MSSLRPIKPLAGVRRTKLPPSRMQRAMPVRKPYVDPKTEKAARRGAREMLRRLFGGRAHD